MGCVEDEPEGPLRECRKEGFARWVTPVERADTDPGVRGDGGEWHSSAFPPDRRGGGGEHAVTVGRSIATQVTLLRTRAGRCPRSLAHPPDDGRVDHTRSDVAS